MWQPWKCNALFKKIYISLRNQTSPLVKMASVVILKKEQSITNSCHISEWWNYLGSVSFPSDAALSSVLFAHRQRPLWICWSSEARTPLFEHKDVHSSHNKQLQNQKNKPDGMSPVPSSNGSLSVEVLPLYTVNISTESCAVCQAKPWNVFFPIMHFTGPVEN